MAKTKRAKPIPLTKAQLQTEAGQELLELAETITEDGIVSSAEVTRLHRWLHRHASEELATIAFLNEEVDQLREDEKAGGTWPRRKLHRALERVLPKALRQEAKERRQEAENLAFDLTPPPPASPAQPVMKLGAATLLLPVAGLPAARVRAVIAARVARRELAEADVFQDLSTPGSQPPPTADDLARRVAGALSLPTPAAIARVKPPAETVARARYRGEMFWHEGQAWAVFADPEDVDCRYAQVAR